MEDIVIDQVASVLAFVDSSELEHRIFISVHTHTESEEVLSKDFRIYECIHQWGHLWLCKLRPGKAYDCIKGRSKGSLFLYQAENPFIDSKLLAFVIWVAKDKGVSDEIAFKVTTAEIDFGLLSIV